jgi:large subunit ribosomal protein L31e
MAAKQTNHIPTTTETMVKEQRERKPKVDIVARECTIHMSKRLYGVTFKNRAPRAIREIKQFASRAMKTS